MTIDDQARSALPTPVLTDEKLALEWPHMRRLLGDKGAIKRIAEAFGAAESYVDQRISHLRLERTTP